MATVTIELDDATEALLKRVLSSSSRTTSDLIREALLDRLEEIEDAEAIAGFADEPFEPISNAEVMRRLGLDN